MLLLRSCRRRQAALSNSGQGVTAHTHGRQQSENAVRSPSRMRRNALGKGGHQPNAKLCKAKMAPTKRAQRGGSTPKQKRPRREDEDDHLVDEFLMDSDGDEAAESSNEDEEEQVEETADERRVRLAKEFIGRVSTMERQDSDEEESDADEAEGDLVQNRLQRAVYKEKGILHRTISHKISSSNIEKSHIQTLRGHKSSATCVVVGADEERAFSCAKDGSWISWDVETGKKLALVQEQKKELLAISVNSCGSIVAVGGRDNAIHLYDTRTNRKTRCLKHHKDAVTSLAFRRDSPHLYSGSLDRSVKVWDVSLGAYVDTLFGHQEQVTSVCSLKQERVLSCGLDGSLRLFKVPEQTQLVYRSNCINIDAISMISESHFVSAAQDGSLSLWRGAKKKAIATVPNAHGVGSWLSAVSACPYTDLLASGSNDGVVRLWQVQSEEPMLQEVAKVPVVGHVNALDFGYSGKILACAVGQEPRFGRWTVQKKARNGICIVRLKGDAAADVESDEDTS